MKKMNWNGILNITKGGTSLSFGYETIEDRILRMKIQKRKNICKKLLQENSIGKEEI